MKLSKTVKQTLILGILMLVGALIGQPTAQGYLHAADVFILLAAILLPTPHAMAAAGMSGALADLLKGYWSLAPFTLFIKVGMVLLAKAFMKTKVAKEHPEIAVAPAALVPVAGYYLYAACINLLGGNGLASFGLAVACLKKDLLQAGGSILLAVFVYDLYMGIRSGKEALKEQEKQDS